MDVKWTENLLFGNEQGVNLDLRGCRPPDRVVFERKPPARTIHFPRLVNMTLTACILPMKTYCEARHAA